MKLAIDISYQIKECLNNENEWTALLLAELKNIVNDGIPLEQEPCEDCIRRQAVLDDLSELLSDWDDDHNVPLLKAIGRVEDSPSVTPKEPKTGHWIVVPGMNEQCSKCGKFFPLSYFKYRPFEINYCPNCGCKLSEISTGSESEG